MWPHLACLGCKFKISDASKHRRLHGSSLYAVLNGVSVTVMTDYKTLDVGNLPSDHGGGGPFGMYNKHFLCRKCFSQLARDA